MPEKEKSCIRTEAREAVLQQAETQLLCSKTSDNANILTKKTAKESHQKKTHGRAFTACVTSSSSLLQQLQRRPCTEHSSEQRPGKHQRHTMGPLGSISKTTIQPFADTQLDRSKIVTVTKTKIDFPKLVLEKVESNIQTSGVAHPVIETPQQLKKKENSKERSVGVAEKSERKTSAKTAKPRVAFSRESTDIQKAIKQHAIATQRKYTYESHSAKASKNEPRPNTEASKKTSKAPSLPSAVRKESNSARKHRKNVTWSAPAISSFQHLQKEQYRTSMSEADDPDRLLVSERALMSTLLSEDLQMQEELDDRLDVLWSRGRKETQPKRSAGVLRMRRARDLHPVTSGLRRKTQTRQQSVSYRVLPEALKNVRLPIERAAILEQILRARELAANTIESGMSLQSLSSGRSLDSTPTEASLTTVSKS